MLKSFYGNDSKRRCNCFIDGQECIIDFYIRKDGKVRIMPVGKTAPIANKLIEYIGKKTIKASVDSKTWVFYCENSVIEEMVTYFETECNELVNVTVTENSIKLKGYAGDTVTCTFYEKSGKLVIQAKPVGTFCLLVTFLSQMDGINMSDIINITNELTSQNITQEVIRSEMKNMLPNSYDYLEEALKKSIAGSLILLKRKDYSEDYSGYVTGEFKALEGYLKKLLTQRYNYKFTRQNKNFYMFFREGGEKSQIDKDNNIPAEEKAVLNELYSIYQNKRNVYLHSSLEPSQTKIVENISEVQSLSNQILSTIERSFNIIFK